MDKPFKLVVKARGGEGTIHIIISAVVVLIAGSFAIMPVIIGEPPPSAVTLFLTIIAAFGLWHLARGVMDMIKNREWEICAYEDRLQWVMRDHDGETIEGEIRLREIRALIYHAGAGDEAACLEVEFIDGLVKKLPLVGAPSESSLLTFINYWREAHAEIPIRNLDNF